MATKLHPPPLRPGTVPRSSLVDRLLAADAIPVLSVVAPPGYGKTTVLAQWARRSRRRVAWVCLDAGDDDPAALLAYVTAALDRVAPGPAEPAPAFVPRVTAALAEASPPVALVLDQAELLADEPARRAVAELAVRLPLGSQLVVASRTEPPLQMALLRSRGQVVEVGPRDLAMDRREARLLLEAAGTSLPEPELTRLLRRTEGWPVGLYLAAAGVEAGPARNGGADGGDGAGPGPAAVTGDDRVVAEYFRSELLAGLPAERAAFLTRTSVLDDLSAPLCDAVLETSGSGGILEALEHDRVFLVPLDRRRRRYRYHRLFRDFLRAELHRLEPERARRLHARAAGWLEAEGRLEAAVAHADAAGDADEVARLVVLLVLSTDTGGRDRELHRWLEWFDDRGVLDRYPRVALLGAVIHALAGDAVAADRWVAAAGDVAAAGELPDGSRAEAWSALLGALTCRNGPATMLGDAESARGGLGTQSPWRALAVTLEGVAHLLLGAPDTADATLTLAVEVAEHTGALSAGSLALAERALVAAERHDWAAAEALVDEARGMVRAGRLGDRAAGAVVRAVAARVAAHRGDAARAGDDLGAATRLRSRLTYAVPTLALQVRLLLAATRLERVEATEAGTLLREAADLLQVRPELGTLVTRAEDLRAKVEALRGQAVGASALTKAELRLLPLLSTHLTFREIAERLHVSRHTVKTQAMSVYRKLGATSRSEAIARVQEIGLLDG